VSLIARVVLEVQQPCSSDAEAGMVRMPRGVHLSGSQLFDTSDSTYATWALQGEQ